MPSHRPGARAPQWSVAYLLRREGLPALPVPSVVTPTAVGAGLVLCASAGLLTVVLTGQHHQPAAGPAASGDPLATGAPEPAGRVLAAGAPTQAPRTAAAPAAPPTGYLQGVTGTDRRIDPAFDGGRTGEWRSPAPAPPPPVVAGPAGPGVLAAAPESRTSGAAHGLPSRTTRRRAPPGVAHPTIPLCRRAVAASIRPNWLLLPREAPIHPAIPTERRRRAHVPATTPTTSRTSRPRRRARRARRSGTGRSRGASPPTARARTAIAMTGSSPGVNAPIARGRNATTTPASTPSVIAPTTSVPTVIVRTASTPPASTPRTRTPGTGTPGTGEGLVRPERRQALARSLRRPERGGRSGSVTPGSRSARPR